MQQHREVLHRKQKKKTQVLHLHVWKAAWQNWRCLFLGNLSVYHQSKKTKGAVRRGHVDHLKTLTQPHDTSICPGLSAERQRWLVRRISTSDCQFLILCVSTINKHTNPSWFKWPDNAQKWYISIKIPVSTLTSIWAVRYLKMVSLLWLILSCQISRFAS